MFNIYTCRLASFIYLILLLMENVLEWAFVVLVLPIIHSVLDLLKDVERKKTSSLVMSKTPLCAYLKFWFWQDADVCSLFCLLNYAPAHSFLLKTCSYAHVYPHVVQCLSC